MEDQNSRKAATDEAEKLPWVVPAVVELGSGFTEGGKLFGAGEYTTPIFGSSYGPS